MLQVIYKRGKIPLVLFRFLKKKKKQKNKYVILSSLLATRSQEGVPMTAADPISLGCLSHLRQPLPAPHSRSLQVILNPPADRGPARIRPALLASGSPGRVPGWGNLHPGAGTLGPQSPPQRSAPSEVLHPLARGGEVRGAGRG